MWPFSWLARIRRSRHRKACREQERFEKLLEQRINWDGDVKCPHHGRPDYVHSTCCYYCGDEEDGKPCRGRLIPCVGAQEPRKAKVATPVAPRGRQRQEARFSSELEACQRVYVDDGSSDMSTPDVVAWRVPNATPPGGYVIFQQAPAYWLEKHPEKVEELVVLDKHTKV